MTPRCDACGSVPFEHETLNVWVASGRGDSDVAGSMVCDYCYMERSALDTACQIRLRRERAAAKQPAPSLLPRPGYTPDISDAIQKRDYRSYKNGELNYADGVHCPGCSFWSSAMDLNSGITNHDAHCHCSPVKFWEMADDRQPDAIPAPTGLPLYDKWMKDRILAANPDNIPAPPIPEYGYDPHRVWALHSMKLIDTPLGNSVIETPARCEHAAYLLHGVLRLCAVLDVLRPGMLIGDVEAELAYRRKVGK